MLVTGVKLKGVSEEKRRNTTFSRHEQEVKPKVDAWKDRIRDLRSSVGQCLALETVVAVAAAASSRLELAHL